MAEKSQRERQKLERRARQLRDNLKRRKAQARARKSDPLPEHKPE